MPTTSRANRTDGDAEAGAAEAEKCKKARVTLPVLTVRQMVLQHAAEALADKTKELTDKTKELTDVLGLINNDQLVAEPDVWLQHRLQRTTRRIVDALHSQPFPERIIIEGRSPCKSSSPLSNVFLAFGLHRLSSCCHRAPRSR